ncbi:DHH family phosphoesterase [Arthrobacter bambusae]|uniref:Single-stranded-DNA-specific exonuclease n=1 Tax=Arthrobacter bambusae TaxID=1338426 RepID=A0AAW8DEM1_9MICC|nr:DHH family phosphoesterase [Arthrobacter bambusae]MDP9904725.1 single-stranded-DNA-specific exonuclease [Arthrobacter bambusae]MDQ0129541.1 single-stranded-DNA-specific exonuclease [Arthrobacter bambusae]MDQ0180846.1 single-stranded-DNA-specific exonuclease [Arthrobacter bambusae]
MNTKTTLPHAARQWRADETEPAADLFALLCQRRGWSDEYLAAIDVSEHAVLKDLDTMVAALDEIRQAGGVITIAPDFDMDGISSGVLGYAGLKELGFSVNLHVPDYRRGHDLTVEDIQEIHERFPGTTALLTCDGGVNSHAGISAAKMLSWRTLVTDHHQELKPGSQADITVDPCRLDETYALRGICGAHVLYQVLEAYALAHQPYKLWAIRLLRLFAGLGTISDVMPLLYENRQLVRDSLSIARLLHVMAPKTIPNQWGGMDPDPDAVDISRATLLQLLATEDHDPAYLAAFEGFAALLKAFAQTGKVRDIDSVNEGFYGFYLAPAMNSPRRTGYPIDDCFAVFTAPNIAERLAAMHRIIENNERRKELTALHLAELTDGDQPLAPWVFFSGAPSGMYGLLANQMMDQLGHPVVVVNRPTAPEEPVSGSGRAPGWFDIITTLDGYDELFAIGHQQACGVKLRSAKALDQLVTILEDSTRVAMLTACDAMRPTGDLVLGAGSDCDATLVDTEPLVELVRRVEKLRPFGHEFTEPVVEIVLDRFAVKAIGSEKQHLRLTTATGLACLWWNAAEAQLERLAEIAEDATAEPTRFLAKLQLNEFLGETRLQAVIERSI